MLLTCELVCSEYLRITLEIVFIFEWWKRLKCIFYEKYWKQLNLHFKSEIFQAAFFFFPSLANPLDNIFRKIYLSCFVLSYIRVGTVIFHTLYFLAEGWYNFQNHSSYACVCPFWYNLYEKFSLDSLLNKGHKKCHILGGLWLNKLMLFNS